MTSESKVSLTSIEAAARAATPGLREVIEHSWSDTSVCVGAERLCLLSIEAEATEDTQDALEAVMRADAAFIASCSPDVVLALVEAVRAAIAVDKMIFNQFPTGALAPIADLRKALEGIEL